MQLLSGSAMPRRAAEVWSAGQQERALLLRALRSPAGCASSIWPNRWQFFPLFSTITFPKFTEIQGRLIRPLRGFIHRELCCLAHCFVWAGIDCGVSWGTGCEILQLLWVNVRPGTQACFGTRRYDKLLARLKWSNNVAMAALIQGWCK